MSEYQERPTAEDDALKLLAEHEPIKTYEGLLGVVLACPICGENSGASELDALRRHDVAVLVGRVFPPAVGCTCGRDTYDGSGKQWLSHAPNCRLISPGSGA